MTKPCKSIDLLYLNERYEYRVIATSVMDHILMESDLSDGAKTLWLILYRASALNLDMQVEASITFLVNKTGRSQATLWRQIRELKKGGYLNVVTRRGVDKEMLPNIYSPRLPDSVIELIKLTAKPREIVSHEIAEHEYNETINGLKCREVTARDYENLPSFSETDSNSNTDSDNTDTEAVRNASNLRSETFSDESRVYVALHSGKSLTDDFRNHDSVTFEGVKIEMGEGVKSDTEKTITPSEKDYTTTGSVKLHSRDHWKMYPHLRIQVRQKLEQLNLNQAQVKKLLSEIDWTLKFGSMEWWSVPKAVNVCLKLIREGRWQTPHFKV